jgi:GNAT superfamily N-acetyltransferase
MKNCHVRALQQNEVEYLYQALKNSAEENNIGNRFLHPKEYLYDMIFSEKKASALVAECNGELSAYLLYSPSHNNFMLHAKPGIYLHALYVRPSYRRQKIATKLIETLIANNKNQNIGRIDFSLLTHNNIGELFLKSLQFQEVDFIKPMRLNL